MILVDTSVWVALLLDGHLFSTVARAWMAEQDQPGGGLLVCRATQRSLLRLLTTASVFAPGERPMTNAQAWVAYRRLMDDERVSFVAEPADVESRWESLSALQSASPKIWMDAYLAAFAIAGGYRLVTSDAGFRHYDGLDLVVLKER